MADVRDGAPAPAVKERLFSAISIPMGKLGLYGIPVTY